jgi:hypothetical protein
MRSSHAIVSVLIRLSYARSLRRTLWANPLLRYRVLDPGSSLSPVMRPFTRIMHSFNTALPRQRYGTRCSALHETYGVALISLCS